MLLRCRAIALILLCTLTSCASSKNSRKGEKGVVRTQGGAYIELYGFSLDPSYDPRLDSLIPGYRVINVAFVNQSLNIIMLSPGKDRWFAMTGTKGKKHQAIIDLRREDPAAWSKVPEEARQLLSYPLVVPIGARLVLDLFVPAKVPLEELTEVVVKFESLPTTMRVSVRE